jgi:hypothetical protein
LTLEGSDKSIAFDWFIIVHLEVSPLALASHCLGHRRWHGPPQSSQEIWSTLGGGFVVPLLREFLGGESK